MKPPEEIVLPLDTIDQLVELLPASPFIKRRLTEDAEKFIIERASALPRARTFKLIVCVPESDAVERQRVTEAVHQHFIFRREEAEKELSRVRQMGWRSLLIGLVFLSVTILVVELIKRYPQRVTYRPLLKTDWRSWRGLRSGVLESYCFMNGIRSDAMANYSASSNVRRWSSFPAKKRGEGFCVE